MAYLISDALAEPNPAAQPVVETTPESAAYQLSPEKMFTDTLVFLFLLFAIFYFILIRPQQRRFKAHKDMLSRLTKGNKVLTSGGLIGTVVKFEGDDVAVLEVAQGVKVRVARGMISEVLTKDSSSDTANDN